MAQTPQQATQAVIDRLTAARDSDRLQTRLIDDLQDEPFTRLTEWAESLTSVAEHLDTFRDALEEWRDADGDREARADAKERALESLGELLDSWDQSPLDLTTLTDWTPEDAE